MSKIIISVVICTYNRADLARNAITSVLEQDFPRKEYELLIVDNASTDYTREMAQEFCNAYPNVRYVMETNIGLSHARNRGWQEACGEYVGYLDDDAKASPNWLSAAHDIAKNIRPEAFGGPYYAFYNSPKPAWFKDEYGSHVQGNESRVLMENEYLDGGNMFIRRDLLVLYDGFHVNMGMKGSEVAYGEETKFFKQLRANEEKTVLFYDSTISIYHLVREDKMNILALPKRFYISGVYWTRVNNQHKQYLLKSLVYIFKCCVQIIFSIFRGLIARDRSKYPYFENYLYEVVFLRFSELGSLVEIFHTSSESE